MAPMQLKQDVFGASNDHRASGEQLGGAGSCVADQDAPDGFERGLYRDLSRLYSRAADGIVDLGLLAQAVAERVRDRIWIARLGDRHQSRSGRVQVSEQNLREPLQRHVAERSWSKPWRQATPRRPLPSP